MIECCRFPEYKALPNRLCSWTIKAWKITAIACAILACLSFIGSQAFYFTAAPSPYFSLAVIGFVLSLAIFAVSLIKAKQKQEPQGDTDNVVELEGQSREVSIENSQEESAEGRASLRESQEGLLEELDEEGAAEARVENSQEESAEGNVNLSKAQEHQPEEPEVVVEQVEQQQEAIEESARVRESQEHQPEEPEAVVEQVEQPQEVRVERSEEESEPAFDLSAMKGHDSLREVMDNPLNYKSIKFDRSLPKSISPTNVSHISSSVEIYERDLCTHVHLFVTESAALELKSFDSYINISEEAEENRILTPVVVVPVQQVDSDLENYTENEIFFLLKGAYRACMLEKRKRGKEDATLVTHVDGYTALGHSAAMACAIQILAGHMTGVSIRFLGINNPDIPAYSMSTLEEIEQLFRNRTAYSKPIDFVRKFISKQKDPLWRPHNQSIESNLSESIHDDSTEDEEAIPFPIKGYYGDMEDELAIPVQYEIPQLPDDLPRTTACYSISISFNEKKYDFDAVECTHMAVMSGHTLPVITFSTIYKVKEAQPPPDSQGIPVPITVFALPVKEWVDAQPMYTKEDLLFQLRGVYLACVEERENKCRCLIISSKGYTALGHSLAMACAIHLLAGHMTGVSVKFLGVDPSVNTIISEIEQLFSGLREVSYDRFLDTFLQKQQEDARWRPHTSNNASFE